MTITKRTISLANLAASLSCFYFAMFSDTETSSLFTVLGIGFALISLVAFIEYWQEKPQKRGFGYYYRPSSETHRNMIEKQRNYNRRKAFVLRGGEQ